MKSLLKKTIIGFLLGTPGMAVAQPSHYNIVGKINPQSSSAKVYLMYPTTDGMRVDSSIINDGNFSLKGTVSEPEHARLLINPEGSGINPNATDVTELYLEDGKINITSSSGLQYALITGAVLNSDFNRLKNLLLPSQKKIEAINNTYDLASEEKRRSTKFMDSLQNEYVLADAEMKNIYKRFITANTNSIVSLYALKEATGPVPDVVEAEKLFNSLSPAVQKHQQGAAYKVLIANLKTVSVGASAPLFAQPDTSGKIVSLVDFRGRYVLIDFWASWCAPCRAENPNIVKAYNEFKEKGFTILGISLDDRSSKQSWINAIHSDHLLWPQLSDLKGQSNSVAKLYYVNAIPQNFLIGPDGKIIAKNIRGKSLFSKLNEVLK